MGASGVLLIDKGMGPSSAKVLNPIKHRLKLDKIGHAGTLDPMATGLLVALTGSATRLARFVEAGQKEYTGEFQLGLRTSTDDITGEILSQCSAIPGFEEIEKAIEPFRGSISQIPPVISAINVDGERAYKRTRRGEEIELAARTIVVETFEIAPVELGRISFRIRCSKGTYIRSLARDLGEALGCGGTLASLRRTLSLPFSVEDAHAAEELTLDHLLNCSALFPGREILIVSPSLAAQLRRGDERVLVTVGPELDAFGQSVVPYREDGASDIGGVLLQSGTTWEFGVNL